MRAQAKRARNRQLLVVGAAVAGAVLIAAGYPFLRRRRTAADDAQRADAQQQWQCDCGQSFRVVGIDRHRVFWLADAPEGNPVMSDRCPRCDRPLPTEHAVSAA
jgi:hypothetical protein